MNSPRRPRQKNGQNSDWRIVLFDANGGGTYAYTYGGNTSTGTITGYTWTQEAYRGDLWPIFFSGLSTKTLTLNFTGNAAGNFSGTAYPSLTPVAGTFSLN
jgi:hypothetical protein